MHGFPGTWRRCNYKRRQWNDHAAKLRLLCLGRKAVGYALHPENRTLQPPVQRIKQVGQLVSTGKVVFMAPTPQSLPGSIRCSAISPRT
ncbi:MAG: hypothetical protein WC091_06850 [Sulfuricellaceae bacterium]